MNRLKSILQFLKKIKQTENCWIWNGGKALDGYGRFGIDGKTVLSHRFSYKLFKGNIPKGLTLDHLCRNKSCVNPEHLEAITQRENIFRGLGIATINARKTHCKNGHELKEPNLDKYQLKHGHRLCRTCNNKYHRLHRANKIQSAKI